MTTDPTPANGENERRSGTQAEWYDPADIARELGCDAKTVYEWIDRGELEAINVARRADAKRARYKISAAAFRAFCRRRTVSGDAGPGRESDRQRTQRGAGKPPERFR